MKYALVNGQKTEPQPGLRGSCNSCQGEAIAKCGSTRIWHWSHKGKLICDPWWENETEWHRAWKNQFPQEWQEIIHYDQQRGVKHIADVRTAQNLVIEFQHSHIDANERREREDFYKNMLWVVNGTRLKNDCNRFFKGFGSRRALPINGYFLLAFPEDCFHRDWLQSTVPVLFDFRKATPATEPDTITELLWCLLPGRAEGQAILAGITRHQFIEIASSRETLLPAHDIVSICAEHVRALRAHNSRQVAMPQFARGTRTRRQRRF